MTRKSGIYTKKGDRGETSLIGGKRVPKHHTRLEAYGSVDELMAQTAMLRDLVTDASLRKELLAILETEMATATMLAVEGPGYPEGLPRITEEQVAFLERSIDKMDASLEPLNSFILPGGHPAVSQAHIARTVCRRTERTILKLNEEAGVDPVIVQFYNRLSDYFFVVSRKIAALENREQKRWKGMLHE